MDRYGQSEVTGGRYSNRRNQEEEEEQGEELGEDEDGQEMETEEAAETRKRQFLLFSSAFFYVPSKSTGCQRWQLTCLMCVSRTAGVNPFAKEAGSPVKPSLTPSE